MKQNKISFDKKITKYQNMAHMISIEKPFIEMLGAEAGDWIRVTIEKSKKNKERVGKKLLDLASEIKGEDVRRIKIMKNEVIEDGEKEKE